jgi:hypothetical protein
MVWTRGNHPGACHRESSNHQENLKMPVDPAYSKEDIAIVLETFLGDDVVGNAEVFSSLILSQVQSVSNYTVQQLQEEENE